jgi:hypothetical protein
VAGDIVGRLAAKSRKGKRTCSPSILVNDYGHVYTAAAHFFQDIPDCHALRNVVGGVHDVGDRGRIEGSGRIQIINQILGQDHANDVVNVVLENGKSRVPW